MTVLASVFNASKHILTLEDREQVASLLDALNRGGPTEEPTKRLRSTIGYEGRKSQRDFEGYIQAADRAAQSLRQAGAQSTQILENDERELLQFGDAVLSQLQASWLQHLISAMPILGPKLLQKKPPLGASEQKRVDAVLGGDAIEALRNEFSSHPALGWAATSYRALFGTKKQAAPSPSIVDVALKLGEELWTQDPFNAPSRTTPVLALLQDSGNNGWHIRLLLSILAYVESTKIARHILFQSFRQPRLLTLDGDCVYRVEKNTRNLAGEFAVLKTQHNGLVVLLEVPDLIVLKLPDPQSLLNGFWRVLQFGFTISQDHGNTQRLMAKRVGDDLCWFPHVES